MTHKCWENGEHLTVSNATKEQLKFMVRDKEHTIQQLYAEKEKLQKAIDDFMESPFIFTLEAVAEILCEAFGDPCACNFNGNDEWLPQKCKYGLTDCPDPPDEFACWKEFLLHRKEAKNEDR